MKTKVLSLVNGYPVRVTLVASFLLSLVAVLGVAAVGRDAALYLDIAAQVAEHGPKIAFQSFDWPWFAFLLAGSHVLTGLPVEWCAYLWCATFMAGTCALLVDAVRRRVPEATGWACLVVLAMPAVNQFRDEVIREFGFWFFCTLALWLALRWQERHGWLRMVGVHAAIGGAILFRLEALMLEVALGLWLLGGLRQRQGWLKLAQFALLPALALVVAALVLLAKGGLESVRVKSYLGLIDPYRIVYAFNQLATQFGDSLTYKFSRDEAGRIVFFGVVAALVIKIIALTGPFCLPFLRRETWQALRTYVREFRPFVWGAVVYAGVLLVFFISKQFMISRYVSMLDLLLVPLLAVGAMLFARQFPRLGKALVVVGLLMMLANVISTGAGKPHIVEAGRWISEHVEPQARIYYQDGRVSYYAGRGYVRSESVKQALGSAGVDNYSYFALKARPDEPWLIEWMKQHQLRVLASFSNRKRSTFVVIGR